jgi:hypothetical protein
MNADSNETELDPRALAISVWENEGGSQAPDTPDGQFGRRVEMDRSWTIYHVFTGVPARPRNSRDPRVNHDIGLPQSVQKFR